MTEAQAAWGVAVGAVLIGLIVGWLARGRVAGGQIEAAERTCEDVRLRLAQSEAAERELEGSAREVERLRGQMEVLQKTPERLASAESERDKWREMAHEARAELQAVKAREDEAQRSLREKVALLERSEKRLGEQFETIAARLFEAKSEAFRAQSAQSMESLLKPFREHVSNLQHEVREANKDRHALRTEISRIVNEASALTRALRADTQKQGAWGEVVLESILANSGLRKGQEYMVQEVHQGEDGGRLRPDVIVRLPEGKDVVVDSKVTLKAYEAYHAAEDDELRAVQAKAHVQAIRQHIKRLSAKRYDAIDGLRSLDFTLMFVPVEAAYMLALSEDPELVDLAMAERIMVVSPTTLMAVLKTIDSVWRRERQNQNAIRIAERAGRLYDKVAGFVSTMQDVGKSIEQAGARHEKAVQQLSEGRGSVLRQVEMLRAMGASTTKSLPGELVSDEDDDLEDGKPREEERAPA